MKKQSRGAQSARDIVVPLFVRGAITIQQKSGKLYGFLIIAPAHG
jgi:hypothetical protein